MVRLRQDLSFGFRSLLRRPGVTVVAVLTLALGIGANVAMVSFAEAVLFPDLPYEDPDRLVVLERWKLSEPDLPPVVSFPALSDWRQRNRICSDIGVLVKDRRILAGGHGEPERIESRLVSAALLPILGIRPALGRAFTPEDDRRDATRAAMITYELWQRRFGGDPEILEQKVTIDDHQYDVIGVLPAGLSSHKLGPVSLRDVWLPVSHFYEEFRLNDRRIAKDWAVVCRLEPNVSIDAARADMARINRELAEEYPLTDDKNAIRVTSVREHLIGDVRPVVLALIAVVVFVLVIACTNLIHLYLVRAVARLREFALRIAQGADRRHLLLQGMSEALVLTLGAGVVGMVVSAALVRALPAVLTEVPHAANAQISPITWAYAVLLGLVVTLILGLVPVLTLSPSWQHLSPGAIGFSAAPVHRRLREALIVGEIALAVVVLTGTGLALATYLNLRDEDTGFSTEHILTMEIALAQSKYRDATAWTAYFDQVVARANDHPGVVSAAVTSALPLGDPDDFHAAGVVAGDRPTPPMGKRELTQYVFVSPDFYQILDIPLLEGRTFTEHDDDREGAPQVIVLGEKLAQLFWPDRSALGQKVGFEFVGENSEVRWREVVGVVGDVRYQGLRQAPQHTVYVPDSQRPVWMKGRSPNMTLVAKTVSDDPLGLAEALRSELLEIDPGQLIDGIRTLEQVVDEELADARVFLLLLTFFAGLAVLLAMLGIYGVVSYLVTGRRREIGLRMALGARPAQVLVRLILQHLVPVAIGIGIGLILAALLTRFLSSQLHGVDPLEPVIFLAGGVSLALVALLATLIPALQAARIDPSQALRYE